MDSCAGCRAGNLPGDSHNFRTIMADPPWDIPQNRGGCGVDRHYPLMRTKQIAELPRCSREMRT